MFIKTELGFTLNTDDISHYGVFALQDGDYDTFSLKATLRSGGEIDVVMGSVELCENFKAGLDELLGVGRVLGDTR